MSESDIILTVLFIVTFIIPMETESPGRKITTTDAYVTNSRAGF